MRQSSNMPLLSGQQNLVATPAQVWRRPPIGAGAAVAAIGAHQRYVSPHKGYCCAWGVHTGKTTCSAWGRRVMGRYGLVRGWALLMRQFRRCHQAAVVLLAQSLVMADMPPAPLGEGKQASAPNDLASNEPRPPRSKRENAWFCPWLATESAAWCCIFGALS